MNRRYCNGMVHVIKPGDTLYQLSRYYRIPMAMLLRANPYVDVYNLQVGQEICIPMAHETTWEEFVRLNNLDQVALQEDQILYFTK